ncbi:MAG TPA: hypothetical protein DDZ88_12435 [Verrucomicrobiales bacterium]|nr:hypothetical protein [Verrucomicrobiales bacterium]
MNADAILYDKPATLLNGESFFLWELGQRRVIEHWMDHLFRSNAMLTLWLEKDDPALATYVRDTFPLCKQVEVKVGVPEAATDASAFVDASGAIQLQRGTAIVPCLPDQPVTKTWFAMVKRWLHELQKFGTQLPELETQISPGVIIGHHCSISKDTVFNAPCWIGSGSTISGATIGPNVVVGEDCVITAGTHITDSYVLSRTFIRPNMKLDGIIATPKNFIDHATGEPAVLS